MQIVQHRYQAPPTSADDFGPVAALAPHLVLVFGSVSQFKTPGLLAKLRSAFSEAELVGCTTAGEISNDGVSDDSLVVTGIRFVHPKLTVATTQLTTMEESDIAGKQLAKELTGEGLHNVLLFGQGVNINGSALIDGLRKGLPGNVVVSGGLAGDGGAFKETFTLSRDEISANQLVAIGFYDPHTHFHHGSFGGWNPFGPARRVTRCFGNVLYELDGEPALAVYKRYLGEYAKDLPASGLLFPFEMLGEDHNAVGLIRTILGVDEQHGSLILAGDIVENGYLKLMHASTDSLVDGAQAAAEKASKSLSGEGASLALLVSCVGRKLVMGARVDEEVEAVADVFGKNAQVTGFYSNGEISPLFEGLECKLHNQTMTITHISEHI